MIDPKTLLSDREAGPQLAKSQYWRKRLESLLGLRFGPDEERVIQAVAGWKIHDSAKADRRSFIPYFTVFCLGCRNTTCIGLRAVEYALKRNARCVRCSQTGENNSGWKGGRKVTENGYVLVLKPEHPQGNRDGYVCEHRLVMEERLGRHLLPHETVHHLNGIRRDNRLGNLELWSSRHPKGQRVTDLIDHCVEMLRLYQPEKLSPRARLGCELVKIADAG